MAVGFQYRLCYNFPDLNERGQTIRLDPQQILIGDEYRPAHSSITYDKTIQYSGYKKYLIIHETERKIRVRFGEHILESVIQQLTFDLFLAPDKSHVFINAKETYCEELLRRIADTYPGFDFRDRRIDLTKMQREDEASVSGGWFRKLKAVDLSAAALFGEEVTGSKEWERYVGQGEISILHLTYLNNNDSYKISVSTTGGIVLYNNLQEHIQIEVVDRVSQQIEPYVLEDSP